MRKQITKPANAKKGDLVVIVCRLRKSQSYARLSIWSACEGDELSPYVPYEKMGVLYGGKPHMVQPMYKRLVAEGLRKHTWRFYAEEALTFCVMQEVDKSDEQLAKARIKIYGKVAAGARRTFTDFIRVCSRYTKNLIWPNGGRREIFRVQSGSSKRDNSR